jgi:hypothetical protein
MQEAYRSVAMRRAGLWRGIITGGFRVGEGLFSFSGDCDGDRDL